VVRISVLGEYLSIADFPVLGARDVRSSGALALGYVFHESGEAYLSYSGSANANTRGSPPLMQTQGDLNVGIKGALRIGAGFHLGADLRFVLFPGLGTVEISQAAVGFAPSALATWDARAAAPSLPLRLHANVGFSFDGTGELLRGAAVSSAEEFALALNRYHRVGLAVGAEVPLPYATPFAEYGLAYPLATKKLLGPDAKPVSLLSAMPQQLTVGVRFTALRDLTVQAAVDLGLTRSVAQGIAATPPYNLLLGVSYAFDPSASGVVRVAERAGGTPPPKEAALPPVPAPEPRSAAVELALTSGKQRVAAAHLNLCGPQRTQVAVGADGTARLELPKGHYSASVDADGYRPETRDFEVPESGEIRVEVDLSPAHGPGLAPAREDRLQLKQQIHFAVSKALILPDSDPLLDQVTELIRKADVKKLRIEGHTDSLGDKAVNLRLSRERASAVLESLAQRGVDRARLVAEGFGDVRPVAPNLTARGRELNRRVEFVILDP
jgi:outer membrane protein OmpA-like peptidoglycan-associated protein